MSEDRAAASQRESEGTKILSVELSIFNNEKSESLYSPTISLPEELLINMRWQWDNNLDSCRNALSTLVISHSPTVALQALQYGQRHNSHVVELYRIGASTLVNFWDLLCAASTWVPDFGELQINLNWQFENNLQSLIDAHLSFSTGNNVAAMYYLMHGQRHNPNVMNLYRACFGANAPRLIDTVRKMVTGKADSSKSKL